MKKLIDAEAIKIAKFVALQNDYAKGWNDAIDAISENAPAEDAEPVRHGKWIVWDEIIAGIYHTVSECSECGFTTDKMFREEMPYCPNCGARMDGE